MIVPPAFDVVANILYIACNNAFLVKLFSYELWCQLHFQVPLKLLWRNPYLFYRCFVLWSRKVLSFAVHKEILSQSAWAWRAPSGEQYCEEYLRITSPSAKKRGLLHLRGILLSANQNNMWATQC